MSTRARTHAADRASIGHPANPRRPVQLGTAVSRKPVIAAAMKPNSISCACQSVGGQFVSRDPPKPQINTQSGTRIVAEAAAARKLARKPLEKIADRMSTPVID